jgi:hypothetical protein
LSGWITFLLHVFLKSTIRYIITEDYCLFLMSWCFILKWTPSLPWCYFVFWSPDINIAVLVFLFLLLLGTSYYHFTFIYEFIFKVWFLCIYLGLAFYLVWQSLPFNLVKMSMYNILNEINEISKFTMFLFVFYLSHVNFFLLVLILSIIICILNFSQYTWANDISHYI